MYIAFLIIFIISGLSLIISVLLQPGKSEGLGSITGGAEQLFGSKRGERFERMFDMATRVSAIFFMVSALMLVYLS